MSHKNLDPIGSAVLTFIGYKQTNKHQDRQAKFIYRLKYQISMKPGCKDIWIKKFENIVTHYVIPTLQE